MSSINFILLMTSVSCVDRHVMPECQNLASKLSYHKQNQKITLHVCEILNTCRLLDPHTLSPPFNLLTMFTVTTWCLSVRIISRNRLGPINIFLYSPEFPLNLELQPPTLGTFSCSWICHSISPTKYRRLPDPACHVVKQNWPRCEVTETYEKVS